MDEEDISALEYARLNGLARNHLTDNLPFLLLQKLQEAAEKSLTKDEHLVQFIFSPECDTNERLSVSKGAGRLLAWVMNAKSNQNHVTSSISRGLKIKMNYSELPLLRSDHDSDVTKFAQRDGFLLHLKDIRLPLEVFDTERDQGLEFSTALCTLGTDMLNELKKEKLVVTRESLQFIEKSIRSVHGEANGLYHWAPRAVQTGVSIKCPS